MAILSAKSLKPHRDIMFTNMGYTRLNISKMHCEITAYAIPTKTQSYKLTDFPYSVFPNDFSLAFRIFLLSIVRRIVNDEMEKPNNIPSTVTILECIDAADLL